MRGCLQSFPSKNSIRTTLGSFESLNPTGRQELQKKKSVANGLVWLEVADSVNDECRWSMGWNVEDGTQLQITFKDDGRQTGNQI